jgi:hypothetical protein
MDAVTWRAAAKHSTAGYDENATLPSAAEAMRVSFNP